MGRDNRKLPQRLMLGKTKGRIHLASRSVGQCTDYIRVTRGGGEGVDPCAYCHQWNIKRSCGKDATALRLPGWQVMACTNWSPYLLM